MNRVKAQFKWLRIGPRKLARVASTVRGQAALPAIAMLGLMPQKGAKVLEKLLKSAVANARQNHKMSEEKLVIDEIFVNKGIVMKRWAARARGRGTKIQKFTSHVTVFVKEAA